MTDLASHPDDLVAAFQIEGQPVRGRIVRLGDAVDDILGRHDYPEPVANLLGEACALAALVGSALKFEGRLIVQAQGDGPVKYVVVDYDTAGSLRGYCRFDAERVAEASAGFVRPGARTLLGQGVFIMTIDPVGAKDRYQGVTPIEGETLALCAEQYFAQSEQVPTRVRLAVGELTDAEGKHWRAGGAMIQNVAEDDARGSTREAWERADILFSTLAEDELVDPQITPETLLYRLFHEDGVRMFEAKPLKAFCRCTDESVRGMLRSFPPEEWGDMVEPDGNIHVTCEYCSRRYDVEPDSLKEEAEG
ncbi:MAG: Hsp33 family molecular chaperone [Caulobacterales bacterium 32-69-10]|nr:MAG: Hsp33 family molecular chaperone [Caulobacterales bacterium 32-69-10]